LLAAPAAARARRATRLRRDKRRVRGIASIGGRPQRRGALPADCPKATIAPAGGAAGPPGPNPAAATPPAKVLCNCNSPPFPVPAYVVLPARNDTLLPSTLPSSIATGWSPPPPPPPPAPSHRAGQLSPVLLQREQAVAPRRRPPPPPPPPAGTAGGTGRHSPVMPDPTGISRRHSGTAGRAFAALAAMVTAAAVNPGEVTSTVTLPACLPACTIPMHNPQNALRVAPLSDSRLEGCPLPTPISRPDPEP